MKRKLVTKIISVAMATCMMAGMLTGCGSSGDTSGAASDTSGGGVKRLRTMARRRRLLTTVRRRTLRIREVPMLPANP